MLLNGRIAGVSGIFGEALTGKSRDWAWRTAFIAGLIVAPLLAGGFGFNLPVPEVPGNWPVIIIGGLLVGIGARLGNGCTSAHGMCGVARLSRRSLVATMLFMSAAVVVVATVRHGIGG